MSDETNAFVAETATRVAALSLDDVALLGVAGPDGAMKALIRLPNGSVVSAGPLETTALGRLLAVTPAGVTILRANGTTIDLPLARIG